MAQIVTTGRIVPKFMLHMPQVNPSESIFNFWDMTSDLCFIGQSSVFHCIQCNFLWVPAQTLKELHTNNHHQNDAYDEYFYLLWTFWPWPYSQGHSSPMNVLKLNLKTWHVFSFVGVEIQYHACRLTFHRCTCCMTPRSVWPLWRSWEVGFTFHWKCIRMT